jgi:hypothetical protein
LFVCFCLCSVSSVQYCMCLWTVHFRLPLCFPLTFI